MTRVALCGEALAGAAEVLGLEVVRERPDIVLLDVGDADAVSAATAVDPAVPRIVVADPERAALLRALGSARFAVASAATPAAIGPLITAAIPSERSRPTRVVLITGVAGGCGRTLLAVNLAARLATGTPVVLLDLTGSGAAAWWLRTTPSPWSELEGLIDELSAEHLGVVAAERDGVRVIGGAGPMPSTALAVAAVRAATGLSELVIVDGPALADERAQAIASASDRVLVVAPDDPVAEATMVGLAPKDHWLIGSRVPRGARAAPDLLRVLPDDPSAVRGAASNGDLIGGALGRAYDELAELLAIDAAR